MEKLLAMLLFDEFCKSLNWIGEVLDLCINDDISFELVKWLLVRKS